MNITYTKRELHLMLASIEGPSDVFAFTYHLLNALNNGSITRNQYTMFKGDLSIHLKTI